MNKRQTGADAELCAAQYLSGRGMRITEHNFRCRQGEIDLIGYHNGYLVFVEVKYRATSGKGSPEDAVGTAKQRQICRVADYYRFVHKIRDSVSVRYDVLAIQGEDIRWHQNAFPHMYTRG